MTVEIKILTESDWQEWKHIRLEAVKLHPEAFGGSYEEESQNADSIFQQGLTKNAIFGAYSDEVLIGVAGFFPFSARKQKHKGMLFSMYLKEGYRGQGISSALVESVIAHAKPRVQQVHCTVVTSNKAAIKLYEKHGFEIYGTEPRALKVEDNYHDEHLMVLVF